MLPADEAAFIIRFFNVGDGDSALMETVGKRPFRLLVDTGGSRKEMLRGGRGCVEYLRALRIECLDAVIITHLHMDHMGALTDITGNIPIRRVISGYFPPEDSGTVSCGPKAEKTVRGLTDCLNVWKEGTDLLRRQGCIFEEIRGSGPVAGLGTDLKMTCVLPDASGTERQKRAWDRMYRGEDVFEDEKAAVSRLRNPTSLVLRAEYAGARWSWERTCSERCGRDGKIRLRYFEGPASRRPESDDNGIGGSAAPAPCGDLLRRGIHSGQRPPFIGNGCHAAEGGSKGVVYRRV